MKIRYVIDQVQTMVVREIGFCVGTSWRSVTGSCVPKGMVSARCRLDYVLFTGFAPAYRFHDLLTCAEADCLPRRHIRLVQIRHAGRTIIGVAVIAVVSPDSANPEGFRPAPPHRAQPGYQRFVRPEPPTAWWDDQDRLDGLAAERFDRDTAETPYDYADRDDLGLEILLDQLEREYNDKLWWYGATGRQTKYPPALGSVQELFAYARRKELDLEEIARRNRERQTDQWLSDQHQRDRQRRHDLDADQAEIAAALTTPRRGRTHTDDQDWQATAQTFTARKRRRLYRLPPHERPASRIADHGANALSDAELLALVSGQHDLAVLKGHRWEALYWLALNLGMRQGELLGLTWDALNVDTGTLRVSQQLQRVKQGDAGKAFVLQTTKTKAGEMFHWLRCQQSLAIVHRQSLR